MAKMYLYNGSESLNIIVTLTTHNFMSAPKSYHAVESTDSLVDKFVGWYPDLSLVSHKPDDVEVVGDYVSQDTSPNPTDLMETAKALENQMKAQLKLKQDSLISIAGKQLEDDSIEKAEIKETMLIDTATALENQQRDLAATAKGLEDEQKKIAESVSKAKVDPKTESKVEVKKGK